MGSTNKKTTGGLTLAVLAALFVMLTLVVGLVFRGARVDLTQNRQYTLNEGSKSILKQIDEPLNLFYFFTQKSTGDLPQYQAYATRVRELLEEMASHSNGKIKLTVIDPQPFSEEEDRATEYGLQQVPLAAGDSMFFGLFGSNSTDGKEKIAFFQVEKEAFLEYDLIKLVQALAISEKPAVGIMSSLPMSGGFDPATRQMGEPWVVYQQLSERFDLRPVAVDAKTIEPAIRVLLLVHPKELSEDTQFAVDQFVLRGGRLVVFVDPNASQDQAGADPNNPSAAMFANKSSDLPKLFKAWGVQYDPTQMIADRLLGLPVQVDPNRAPVKHPGILGLLAKNMNQADVISADLETINLDGVGHFKLAPAADAKAKAMLTLEPLLQSSNEASLVATEKVKFLADPSELLNDFTPSNENYVIAGRLKGKFNSAFPERSSEAGYLALSKEDGNVLLIGDTDLLTNRTWVQVQAFLGQQIANAFANNGDFVVNAVDNLIGDNALISIRSRSKLRTSFTRVDEMRSRADDQFRATEQQLQAELKETERKLTDLQQAKGQESQMIISPEQQAELLSFQKKKIDIRKQLRDVRHSLDQDIEKLGAKIKFFGTGLMPLAVIAFAAWYFRRRATRRRDIIQANVAAGAAR